jgi:apolipoprotein D and lipocalin family protein
MPRAHRIGGLAALALLAAVPALAASSPVQPVDSVKLMGRWYEILRTPNAMQHNCFAAYQEWAKTDDGYAIAQVCHRDGPDGKLATVGTAAKALNADNTLFEASFFGGLIHARYQINDHAADYSWMIASTADGRFPKLLARTPGLPSAEQDRLKQRMAQLGFDVNRLQAVGN